MPYSVESEDLEDYAKRKYTKYARRQRLANRPVKAFEEYLRDMELSIDGQLVDVLTLNLNSLFFAQW